MTLNAAFPLQTRAQREGQGEQREARREAGAEAGAGGRGVGARAPDVALVPVHHEDAPAHACNDTPVCIARLANDH